MGLLKELKNEQGMTLLEVMIAGSITFLIVYAGASVIADMARFKEEKKRATSAYELEKQIALELRMNSL